MMVGCDLINGGKDTRGIREWEEVMSKFCGVLSFPLTSPNPNNFFYSLDCSMRR